MLDKEQQKDVLTELLKELFENERIEIFTVREKQHEELVVSIDGDWVQKVRLC